MKFLLGLLLWCVLLVLCWPLAILFIVLLPVVWLILLPFRIVGIVVGAALRFVKAILFFPARLLEPRKSFEARTA